MSGTSLDGLDLCVVHFVGDEHFEWGPVETLPYPTHWRRKLSEAHQWDEASLEHLDKEYAQWLGKTAKEWLQKNQVKVDFISSHGHTIFHQPEKGFTLQIGNHRAIAQKAQLPVYGDFRTQDVRLGGQGAPLVPIGDQLLFSSFRYCLNLGGFSNISYQDGQRRVACDIAPCNTVLNLLASRENMPYDRGGEMAKKGTILKELLDELNRLQYYRQPPPKSLGREWLTDIFLPVLARYDRHKVPDLLRTCTEHFAVQIGRMLTRSGTCLTTGGGAHNTFLIERITALSSTQIFLPENQLIDYKEALIFALLGLLRQQNKINVLSSVTGARRDHCSGTLYLPDRHSDSP